MGSKEFYWVSTGYLSSWERGKFEFIDVWFLEGTIGEVGKWLAFEKELVIVNVYSSCDVE